MTVKEAKSELMTYRVLSEKLAKLHARNVNNHLNLGMMRFRAGDTGRSKALLQRIREAELREIELQKSEYYTAARIEEVRKTIDRKLLMLSELDRKILYEKYLRGRSLIALSMEICYEYTWFCKLHKRALENYAKLS